MARNTLQIIIIQSFNWIFRNSSRDEPEEVDGDKSNRRRGENGEHTIPPFLFSSLLQHLKESVFGIDRANVAWAGELVKSIVEPCNGKLFLDDVIQK